MRRYFSHYTLIYPSIYLKNHVVEVDADFHIIRIFPFSEEIEKTEFYSGLLVFVPQGCNIAWHVFPTDVKQWNELSDANEFHADNTKYDVIYEGLKLR
ncbi:MAG: hypothetical protein E6767_01825 [Dysgonomonas sp.]|nr:hypothetical protein [Dysgonomonas sp.]